MRGSGEGLRCEGFYKEMPSLELGIHRQWREGLYLAFVTLLITDDSFDWLCGMVESENIR